MTRPTLNFHNAAAALVDKTRVIYSLADQFHGGPFWCTLICDRILLERMNAPSVDVDALDSDFDLPEQLSSAIVVWYTLQRLLQVAK